MAKNTKKIEQWQIDDAARLKTLFAAKATCSQAEFGALYGIGNQGYVWQILNGRRPLNIETARAFSVGLKVPIDEFSPVLAKRISAAQAQVGGADLPAEDSNASFVGKAPVRTLIPVVGIAQLGENGWYEEVETIGAEGYIEHFSNDADAYVLRVKGDSMFPAIRNNWYVVVEPNSPVVIGEYVAIKQKDGRKMVKELLNKNSEEISLTSVNGGNRLTLPIEQVSLIHAVAAVVSPSKHKEM